MEGSSKWITTLASIWIQCSCGASYTFAIYSSLLKSSQNYSQSTLDTVSVFKDIGANAGVLAGLLYTALGRRGSSSPWAVYVAGAMQYFVGYFFIWLAVTGGISRPPVPVMCLFMFLAAHAQSFFNTTNVVVAVQNFPGYRGTIIGIMKGFLGLSGAMLIQVYQTLFPGKPSNYLLMLSVFPPVVSLSLMCLVKVQESSTGNEKKHLNRFSLAALTIAAYLMILIISENIFTLALWVHVLTCVILLFLLFSPLTIVLEARKEESLQTASTAPLIDQSDSIETAAEVPVLSCLENMNLPKAMSTMNFWLLFIAMVCGMGSGMATINNIGQIGESLNYSTTQISTLVSLSSIWNFLGRFGAGYVSDFFLHKIGLGRPMFMALTQATMAIGHLIIASGFPGNLFVGSVIVGVCYGSQWSLMPTITSEIFGVRHMGTIFNAIAAANPIGTYILSVKVFGYIYDKQASSEGNLCYGTRCFMLSFLIFASVSLFGFVVSLLVFFRTKGFYEMVVLRRLKPSALS